MLRVLRRQFIALRHLELGEVEAGRDRASDECEGVRLPQ